MEDMGRKRAEGSWGNLEGEVNHERLWTLKYNLRVLKGQGWEVGVPGGGYYRGHGLHGALGVVQK